MTQSQEFKLSIGMFLLFLSSFLIQNYVIFPIESSLFDPSVVVIASLMFIPHGVKVILATLYGYLAILPILVGQAIGIYMYTFDLQFSLSFGAIAVLAVYIPIFLINYLEQGGFEGSSDTLSAVNSLRLGRKVLVIALISSLLNSYFASLLNGVTPQSQIWLRFLFGDMFGAIVVFAIVYVMRGKILRWLTRRVGAETSKRM